MLMKVLVLSVLLLMLTACEGERSPISAPRPTTSSTAGIFDDLTITLELSSSSVRSGRQVDSTLKVVNNSGRTITDPACLIGSARYALVPEDDPGAELWLQPIVDCGGGFKMPDGFVGIYQDRTFPAKSGDGEPLPPGRYIAALEIDGYSERLEQPIEVTG